MKSTFLGCAIYAIALSILVESHVVTYAVIDLFVRTPYVIGTHTEDWMSWHGMGCLFLGLVNLAAWRWPLGHASRDVAFATAIVYGAWTIQNFYFTAFTDRFVPFMWLHVIGCGIAAAASLRVGFQLRGAEHANTLRAGGE